MAFLQLTAVPIKDLSELSFVYGSLRLFGTGPSRQLSPASLEYSQFIQGGYRTENFRLVISSFVILIACAIGVLLQSPLKLFMFATPLSSQRLYLQVTALPSGQSAQQVMLQEEDGAQEHFTADTALSHDPTSGSSSSSSSSSNRNSAASGAPPFSLPSRTHRYHFRV